MPFKPGHSHFMVIHWIEKMKYKQNIKHKTQTYNIFWKKEKPNKTQTELA